LITGVEISIDQTQNLFLYLDQFYIMNEIDVERHRMYGRITTTWIAVLIGIIAGLFFLMNAFENFTNMNSKFLLIAIIAVLLGFKIQPYIERFYEKRLLESKKRNHTL
jgi:hypothetical protein